MRRWPDSRPAPSRVAFRGAVAIALLAALRELGQGGQTVHGTYRASDDCSFGDVAVPGGRSQSWRNVLRLSGCLLVGTGVALVPANPFRAKDRMAQQVVVLAVNPR